MSMLLLLNSPALLQRNYRSTHTSMGLRLSAGRGRLCCV